jgi:hypothetical protein
VRGVGINAAVATTVFHGTGERVRELPIRPSGGARPARPVRACSAVSRQDGSVLADLDAADDDTAQRVDDAAAHPSAVLAIGHVVGRVVIAVGVVVLGVAQGSERQAADQSGGHGPAIVGIAPAVEPAVIGAVGVGWAIGPGGTVNGTGR